MSESPQYFASFRSVFCVIGLNPDTRKLSSPKENIERDVIKCCKSVGMLSTMPYKLDLAVGSYNPTLSFAGLSGLSGCAKQDPYPKTIRGCAFYYVVDSPTISEYFAATRV